MIQLRRNTLCVTLCIVDSGVASSPLKAKGFSVLKRHGSPINSGAPNSSCTILLICWPLTFTGRGVSAVFSCEEMYLHSREGISTTELESDLGPALDSS